MSLFFWADGKIDHRDCDDQQWVRRAVPMVPMAELPAEGAAIPPIEVVEFERRPFVIPMGRSPDWVFWVYVERGFELENEDLFRKILDRGVSPGLGADGG